MTTVTFDTLKFARRLKDAGMAEAQAEAFAEAFQDAQRQVDVVTKADLRAELAELKTDIVKWVAGMLLLQAGLVAALVKLL